ncbi:MAG TPA: YvcK family protein [Elusimicrobiota bacterium]|nr:YvcK family protein [Elusimicrobiota bacterium]
MESPRIVVLGGGTGLSTLLRGLKQFTSDLTAVVTVTDEGGSSGRLRRHWGVLPPGDLRNCLVALAQDDTLVARLFQYRFPHSAVGGSKQDSLAGHSLGNLLLTGLCDVAGGIDRAMAAAGQVLAIRGRVLPVSLQHLRLHARLADGRRVLGEPRISRSRTRIQHVYLTPSRAQAAPGVLKSLRDADAIVIGPGSLYTSVIPPLLVDGVAEAVARSRARKIYVCNVMSQPGETDGYSAVDHLRAVLEHCGSGIRERVVDAMLLNNRAFPEPILRHYAAFDSYPVDPPRQDHFGRVRIIGADLRPSFRGRDAVPALARHSSGRLAGAVIDLLRNRKI